MKVQQVKSKPRRGLVAPLDRDMLDAAGPWLRLLAGLAIISYTSYTTVLGVGADFAPLLKGEIYGVGTRLIGGVLAAALISFVQWLTSERHIMIYSVFLWFDARYTQHQIGPAIDELAAYHLRGVDT
jgi:hypothetical protein